MAAALTFGVVVAAGCAPVTPVITVTPQLVRPTATLSPTITPSPIPTEPGLPMVTPVASLGPRPFATPTACLDAMTLILALTPGAAQTGAPPLAPAGDPLRAGWRIQNAGGCIWDSAYSIDFSATDHPGWQVSASPGQLERSVRPGETLDVWVEAIPPPNAGLQTAAWRLRNGRGETVGEPLTLTVETAALPTAAVAGPWFRAAPDSIQPGERAVLSWSIPDAKAVYLLGAGAPNNYLPVEGTASRFVFPPRTSRYQLEIVRGDDSIQKMSVTVEVEPALAPRISRFVVGQSPTNDACAQIEWITQNRVNRVLIYRNGDLIWDGLLDDGVIQDCPPPGTIVYMLKVFGPGGQAERTRSINLP